MAGHERLADQDFENLVESVFVNSQRARTGPGFSRLVREVVVAWERDQAATSAIGIRPMRAALGLPHNWSRIIR